MAASRAPSIARGRTTASTGAPYVVVAYCDRMDLAYAAADLVVARSGANTVCELTAVGLPAVYVPLPIGNGEQRLNAAAVVAAGGGLLVDDAAVTPAWVDDVVRAPRLDERPAGRDGRGRRVGGGARWRRAARRPRRRGRARRPTRDRPHARATTSPRPCRPRAARPRAPHRHRRRRHVGRRPDDARARLSGQRLRRRGHPRAGSRCATRAPASTSGHDAAHVDDVDTVVVSSAIRDDNVELAAARAAGPAGAAPVPGPRRAHGRRRAGSPSPAPTARPRPPRCSPSRCRRCGADPSFAVGGELAKHGTNAHLGDGDVLRRRGRRERRLVPRLPPRGRHRHQRPARPPRLLRHPRGRRGGLRRLRRVRDRRRARSSPATTTPGRVASPRRRGPPAARCSPTATTPAPTCGSAR